MKAHTHPNIAFSRYSMVDQYGNNLNPEYLEGGDLQPTLNPKGGLNMKGKGFSYIGFFGPPKSFGNDRGAKHRA